MKGRRRRGRGPWSATLSPKRMQFMPLWRTGQAAGVKVCKSPGARPGRNGRCGRPIVAAWADRGAASGCPRPAARPPLGFGALRRPAFPRLRSGATGLRPVKTRPIPVKTGIGPVARRPVRVATARRRAQCRTGERGAARVPAAVRTGPEAGKTGAVCQYSEKNAAPTVPLKINW